MKKTFLFLSLLVGLFLSTFSVVAGPLDVFVQDEQLFNAQTLRCQFTTVSIAGWRNGDPEVVVVEGGELELLFDSISEEKARLIGNIGSDDVLVARTAMGLNFIEQTSGGSWNTTTVFKHRENEVGGSFAAVTSRHLVAPFWPNAYQNYGKCKVLEYHQ
jgi:hypothetical protein